MLHDVTAAEFSARLLASLDKQIKDNDTPVDESLDGQSENASRPSWILEGFTNEELNMVAAWVRSFHYL